MLDFVEKDTKMVTMCLFLLLCVLSLSSAFHSDPPRITHEPKDQNVADKGIVSFFCKAAGNPAPDIYWLRGGKWISPNRNRFLVIDMPHGSVLRIEPVRASRDSSTFECVADNGIGQVARASAVLEVYPAGEMPPGYPVISESPTLKAVEKDRNTIMVCSVEGTPSPDVMWLKDNIPVDLQDARLELLPSGALQIRSSQESDEGTYECVAENSVGVAYSYGANLYVRVRRVPPHFSIPLETPVEVMPGGAVNLTCVAVGSPMPFVKWRLGAVEMTKEESIPIGRNVLQLTNIQESANYTCVAASDLGNIEAVAEVRVKEFTHKRSNFSHEIFGKTKIVHSRDNARRGDISNRRADEGLRSLTHSSKEGIPGEPRKVHVAQKDVWSKVAKAAWKQDRRARSANGPLRNKVYKEGVPGEPRKEHTPL